MPGTAEILPRRFVVLALDFFGRLCLLVIIPVQQLKQLVRRVDDTSSGRPGNLSGLAYDIVGVVCGNSGEGFGAGVGVGGAGVDVGVDCRLPVVLFFLSASSSRLVRILDFSMEYLLKILSNKIIMPIRMYFFL